MYHQPNTLADALDLIAGFDGPVVAGGTDLYPALGGAAGPQSLLDVTRIDQMRGITAEDGALRIGGATCWTDIARADLPPAFAALQQAARQVGSLQIQNAGTIAGNLCNASPAADGVPPLLVLDAEVELASAARGTRRVPLDRFITGVRQTDLVPDELVVALHIPNQPSAAASAFEKLGSRKYLVISIAMVVALIATDDSGTIKEARIAVGSCSAVAQRLSALEAACIGQRPAQVQITADHLAPLAPIDDIRASAAYRQDAAAELIRRAIRKAGTP